MPHVTHDMQALHQGALSQLHHRHMLPWLLLLLLCGACYAVQVGEFTPAEQLLGNTIKAYVKTIVIPPQQHAYTPSVHVAKHMLGG